MIEPDLTGVGLLDFARIDEAIAAGRRAARVAFDTGRLATIA